tara:strand:- start:42 stop:1181 length:1140 start_codon:yes stop_codon:yes gene_type:complete
MKRIIFLVSVVFFITGCSDDPVGLSMDECGILGGDNSTCADCAGTPNGSAVEDCGGVCNGSNASCSDSYIFIAGEGNFYNPGSGSLTYINESGDVTILPDLGSTVHAVEVYQDILLVSVNGDQKILVYTISNLGLEFNMEISTEGQSPRDIYVIGDKAYFPTWDSDWYVYPTIPGYIKVLDLNTFQITESIEVGIMPEGMMYKDGYLWVANSGESSVSKINLSATNEIVEYEVGEGPQYLTVLGGDIYIARTEYEGWNISGYGASKISGEDILIEAHTSLAGAACGGFIATMDNKVYRSYDGGIAVIDEDLQISPSTRIGSFTQSEVNAVEVLGGKAYFAITDFTTMGEVYILNTNGTIESNYSVGIGAGDFAVWSNQN